MQKKNKYVMTLGFNQSDPIHRKAVGILDVMNRGKADYIAKAVVFYEKQGTGTDRSAADLDWIRDYVRQVVSEYTKGSTVPLTETHVEPKQESFAEQIGEDAMQGIMDSLLSFRQ